MTYNHISVVKLAFILLFQHACFLAAEKANQYNIGVSEFKILCRVVFCLKSDSGF